MSSKRHLTCELPHGLQKYLRQEIRKSQNSKSQKKMNEDTT